MFFDFLNLAIGLIAGVLTGFYFERRGSRSAREQHEATLKSNDDLQSYIRQLESELQAQQGELQQQVSRMQESIYSTASTNTSSIRTSTNELTPEVILAEIRDRLGPDGYAPLASIRAHFIAHGHSRTEIELLLDDLENNQLILRAEKQVMLP